MKGREKMRWMLRAAFYYCQMLLENLEQGRRSGTRSHLIADLSTIRQSTSKISCCLSIKSLPTTEDPLFHTPRTGDTRNTDQLIKRNKVVSAETQPHSSRIQTLKTNCQNVKLCGATFLCTQLVWFTRQNVRWNEGIDSVILLPYPMKSNFPLESFVCLLFARIQTSSAL